MMDGRTPLLGVANNTNHREDMASQACGRCGRAAPQPGAVRPGTLSGQVAEAFDLVDRLESVAGELRQSLHTELSTGVERHIAAVRADAAAVIISAHAERDLARQEADAARSALAATRREAARADELMRARAREATKAVQLAHAEAARARERALTDIAEVRAQAEADLVRLREESMAAVTRARQEAAAELAQARAVAAERATDLAEATRHLDAATAERAALQRELDQARTDVDRSQSQLALLGERATDLAGEVARLCGTD